MWIRRQRGPVSEQDLSDFADGELSPARAREVAAHLRTHPRDADRVHTYWQHEARLLEAFDVPQDDGDERFMPAQDSRRNLRQLSWAAVLAGIMMTTGLLWQGPGSDGPALSPEEFAASMLEAYTGSGGDSRPIDEPAPSLAGLDLRRTGTQTLQVGGRDVIVYRYQRDSGETMALYEMQADDEGGGAFQIFERDDTRLVEWTMANKQYALVGEDSASRLTHLAVRIRGNLMTRPGADVEALAGDTGGQLNIDHDVAEPASPSPASKRAAADRVIVPQSVNNGSSNGNNDVGAERVQPVNNEM